MHHVRLPVDQFPYKGIAIGKNSSRIGINTSQIHGFHIINFVISIGSSGLGKCQHSHLMAALF